jgi:exopolyphosphatase/pppGpp-phosphohydrolase
MTATAARNTVRLELAETAGCVRVDANGSVELLSVPIGITSLTSIFQRDPPTEAEIEIAIDLTEQAVMPLAKLLPAGAVLLAGNPLTLRVAALAAGSRDIDAVSIAAVEGLFEQVAIAARRGFWAGEQRMDGATAAGALILRELMHHLGFDHIELPKNAASGLVGIGTRSPTQGEPHD